MAVLMVIAFIVGLPLMAKEIHEGYQQILSCEKKDSDAVTMATEFAKMIRLALSNNFNMSQQQIKIISAISAWIYIIDALDDYDKDVKTGSFNPFIIEGLSFKKYLNLYWEQVNKILKTILGDCLTYDDKDFDYQTIEVIIKQFIPDVTAKIFNEVSLRSTRLKLTWYFCRLRPQIKER
jgi:hypothetical protein